MLHKLREWLPEQFLRKPRRFQPRIQSSDVQEEDWVRRQFWTESSRRIPEESRGDGPSSSRRSPPTSPTSSRLRKQPVKTNHDHRLVMELSFNMAQVEKIKSRREKLAFSEFFWFYCPHIYVSFYTKKSKYLVKGIKSYSYLKDALTRISFFKNDWNSGYKRSNFWFPRPNILIFLRGNSDK